MARLIVSPLLVTALLVAAGCSSSSSPSTEGTPDAGTIDDGGTDIIDDGGTEHRAPCALPETCTAPAPECVGFVDHAGSSSYSLRVADIAIYKPSAFASGVLSGVVSSNAMANARECQLNGNTMGLNWLLQFEAGNKQLTVGGAKPVEDLTKGFSFADENVNGLHVAAVTTGYDVPEADSFQSHAGDVVLPVYLDMAGTNALLFPMKGLTVSGKVSSDHNCIGHYNAEGLDPDNSCEPDSDHPQFLKEGKLKAFITLEDADAVIISQIAESLCVLLSGDSATYGEQNGQQQSVCKRDASNKILFKGDWCATTNSAASESCADAVAFDADFAAQSIKVKQ